MPQGPTRKKTAVDGLSLRVAEGEVFGILGPNGAGKNSPPSRCAEGLQPSCSGGSIRVFGIDPYRDRAPARRLIGAQLQESQLPDKITVAEAVGLYASFYPEPADTEEARRRLETGLTEKRNARYRKLSGGPEGSARVHRPRARRPPAAGGLRRAGPPASTPRPGEESWRLVTELRVD